MAENKLEGFEDFDSVLGDAQAESGEGGDFASELDNLLGGDAAPDEGAAGPADAGADSELDSFFEDLSTIDDLEVLQEDAPPAAAAAAAEPADEPEEDEAPAVAAPSRAAAEPAKPRAAKPPREKKPPGFIRRWFKRLIILAILVGGGYYVYLFFFPDLQPPWEVMEKEKAKVMAMVEEKLKGATQPTAPTTQPPPPPPPPAPAMVEPPKPKPAPRRPAAPKPAPAPARERGPWSIQVATCFFPSCLDGYKSYLAEHKRSVLVRERTSQSESLEIYSISSYNDRAEAQDLADRINREHPLEGHAYIFREDGGYRISMGAFADLARTNVVKDALNQQYRGHIAFATRVKAFPYKLQSVLTGRFPSRAAAETALDALKNAEPRLKDAFVTRND